jgi:primary-amine oxidase
VQYPGLTLGLGLIHYFSGDLITSKGEVKHMKNVICMHEQDEGVGWKREACTKRLILF